MFVEYLFGFLILQHVDVTLPSLSSMIHSRRPMFVGEDFVAFGVFFLFVFFFLCVHCVFFLDRNAIRVVVVVLRPMVQAYYCLRCCHPMPTRTTNSWNCHC